MIVCLAWFMISKNKVNPLDCLNYWPINNSDDGSSKQCSIGTTIEKREGTCLCGFPKGDNKAALVSREPLK